MTVGRADYQIAVYSDEVIFISSLEGKFIFELWIHTMGTRTVLGWEEVILFLDDYMRKL